MVHFASSWTQYANITFDFSGSTPEIRVNFDLGLGSWSYMGTDALSIDGGSPTMNFGWFSDSTSDEEFRRVIVHEFGHALGAIHEHQHPDSGIPWDKPQVYAYYLRTNGWDARTVDAQVFAKYDRSLLNASAYDPKSIMHYAIPPELLTDPSKAVGWNTTVSSMDKAFIAIEYPKVKAAANSLERDPPRKMVKASFSCACPNCDSQITTAFECST